MKCEDCSHAYWGTIMCCDFNDRVCADEPIWCPLIKIELGEEIIKEVFAWWERLYPADIFVGSCDDEGSKAVTRIRQLLEQYNGEDINDQVVSV